MFASSVAAKRAIGIKSAAEEIVEKLTAGIDGYTLMRSIPQLTR